MRVELRTLPIRHVEGDQLGTPASRTVDPRMLERALRSRVRGEVRFDSGTRAIYAHDASNYRMHPIGVVIPLDVKDVENAVAVAREFGVPLISRGGGTSIPGQGVNCALMVDFAKHLNRVVSLDAGKKRATVEPGCVCDTLRDSAEKHGLTFGPDPATHSRCTLGGMIGNNSCGPHTVMAGRTSDNIEELEVLLYDGTLMTVGPASDEEIEKIVADGGRKGQIYRALRDLRDRYADLIRERYPKIPRRVSGYNLDELLPERGFNVARALVGSEGTCVTVLRATCRLVDSPRVRALVVIGFPDVALAGDLVPHCLNRGAIAIEGMDDRFIHAMQKKGMRPDLSLLPEGHAWLIVEYGGPDEASAESAARKFMESLSDRSDLKPRLITGSADQKKLWTLREEGLGATAHVPGERENHEGWEDPAVHPERIGDYLREFQALMAKYDYHGSLYGHFGDGVVHIRLDFDLNSKQGIAHYRSFVEEGADLVVKYNGSLTGEHGDGQARAELLERMYGPELIQAFAEFKTIWDPDWKMNPGKLVAPYKLDENLKVDPQWDPETHFSFPEDRNSFVYATKRCVGAGVCRRPHGGTMCPSYMVTRDEKHCTRGRARILYEMLDGEVVEGGWRSEAVKEALDLCLSCKGCKGDCPVQVDMATYKAEFLSHYYQGRLRPRSAYAFGFIPVWSRFAALAPGFVNLLTHLPGLRELARAGAGIDGRREIPRFAAVPFKSWFARRGARSGPHRVILWADTFNNYFHPTTAQAAVEVLEDAGCEVVVPLQNLCCGRPLYDYGFLVQAKAYLTQVLEALREEIRRGTLMIVLEPSCCTVFRDELKALFPDDPDAKRLSEQTLTLAEFLTRIEYEAPKLKRKALLHGHCHHKSVMRMGADETLLRQMGLDLQIPDSGCCGMAGGFGFESGEHCDLALACGERVLMPEVRDLPPETLVISDGFSCREQMAQGSDRTPLHLAQVIQMALNEGETGTQGPYPEKTYVRQPRSAADDVKTVVLIAATAFGLWKLGSWAFRALRK